MKAQRKNNARAAMHAPEKHADAVLRRLGKIQIPEQQLPIKRVAFSPERCAEQSAVRSIASSHKSLQVMTGNQFVKDGGPRKVNVVAAHTHQLLFVRHGVSGIRNLNCFAAEKEWTDELSLGRHHLHPPGVARELRHCYQI